MEPEEELMPNLVIVESPAKAKTINKILGRDYVVRASMGHVRDLPESGIGIDIAKDFEPTYVPRAKKGVLSELKKLSKDSDKVFLCPDPDREGEAIAWHLAELLKLGPSDYRRVTFNEITSRAITEAFKNPRDIDMNLVNSQQARRILDRIVGYQLSPLLWNKIRMGLSAGRVQSVAVRILAEREKEISAFKPDEYWTIKGSFGDPAFEAQLRLINEKDEERKVVASAEDVDRAKAKKDMAWLANQGQAEAARTQCEGRPYAVSSYETKDKREGPYPPFNTSGLQQAAANRLGFDAKRTMSVAQSLYEGVDMGSGPVGLITYMRTDSWNISQDAAREAQAFITTAFGKDYHPGQFSFYRSKAGTQGAHECVRPTHVDVTPEQARPRLAADQAKLYELVWKRFVASQMSPALYEVSAMEVASGDGKDPIMIFRAAGRLVKFDGWTKLYPKDEDDEPGLPKFSAGQPVTLRKAEAAQHMTQPPPRYTDASLVKTLEKEGIGRPSTYATIISVIQDRGYVEKMGRGGKAPLRATDLGIIVTDALVGHMPSVMDVGFTRDMESELDDVEEGKVGHVQLLRKFYASFKAELDKAKKDMPSTKGGQPAKDPCPKCGRKVMKILGKFGWFLACEDKEKCGYTANPDGQARPKAQAEKTSLKCDKCGRPMLRTTGRFGPYLCCEGYPAKECDFTMKITKAGLPARKLKATPTDVKCECGKKMVIRCSRKGKPFLSCSAFPKCRKAKDVPPELGDPADAAAKAWAAMREKDKVDAAAMRDAAGGAP